MSDDAMQPRDEMVGEGAESEAPEAPPTPVYDQEFFLKLARPREDTDEARAEARERWNKWRRDPANAGRAVTFEGVDFRTEENRGISFEGFEFGQMANFRFAAFGNGAQFAGATFGSLTQFHGARFAGAPQFNGTTFGDGAFFTDVTFGDGARFDSARFDQGARFDNARLGLRSSFYLATFGDRAYFAGATFGDGAYFAGATFGDEAQFAGATFGDQVWFDGSTFGDEAHFDRATFGAGASFKGATGERDVEARRMGWAELDEAVRGRREKDYRERRESEDLGPAKFSGLSFHSAHFRGSVSFARRSFERPADFAGVRFDQPPDFDGATNLQRIDFTGARAGFAPADRPWWKPDWTTYSLIAIRLRALRSQIEATKNHDFERDLYIEERKAERGIYFYRYRREKRWGALAAHSLWIGVMAVYWALSDYGRSWLRPAAWLGASIPVFDVVYAHVLADRQETAVEAAREGVTKSLAGADALAVVKCWQTAEARVRSDYDAVVGQLAVSNAVPFVGPLTVDADAKKFLFCGVWPAAKGETGAGTVVEPCRPIPPPGFQCAMISQNLLSILLVFFIGLALRNYFRLK